MKYDFYGRLKKEFPSQIIIDVTERCNFACTHCPHSIFAKSELYAARDLPISVVEQVVSEVVTYGKEYCQQIRIASDGEPFLHRDIYEILEMSAKSGIFVSVTTNGSRLKDDGVSKLINTGISMVDISIDAYSEETYNSIRIGGKFREITQGVIELIKERNKTQSKTKIVVSFVKQEKNKNETEDFEKYWYAQGIDYVVLRDIHTAGGASKNNRMEVHEDIRRPCVYPWERLCINPRGEILFCPASWEGKSIIGNVKYDTIREIWNSKKYDELRNMHLKNVFKSGHMCEDCKDWMTTAWPGMGRRGYGDMIIELQNKT